MTQAQPLSIRPAQKSDSAAILEFIRGLADYENLLHEVVASEEKIASTLFGPHPAAEVLIAEWENQPAGFALFFNNYSTFLAQPGIYLEDLFVQPAYRGKGIGKSLLSYLAGLAVERNCGRLDWSVLDWNAPAIGFYLDIGARVLDDWTIYRLNGEALQQMANSAAAHQ